MCTVMFEECYKVQAKVKNQTDEFWSKKTDKKNQMAQKWDISAESSSFHCHHFVSPVAAVQLQSVVLMHL